MTGLRMLRPVYAKSLAPPLCRFITEVTVCSGAAGGNLVAAGRSNQCWRYSLHAKADICAGQILQKRGHFESLRILGGGEGGGVTDSYDRQSPIYNPAFHYQSPETNSPGSNPVPESLGRSRAEQWERDRDKSGEKDS
ncbi:hypothetical protein INR49_029802 [Caranx melampygus]|nr:hypothetical protein INR49_029802 [Caranx melampygus]